MEHSRIRRFVKHGTLSQLTVFDAIARLGSFTRAGEELHLAQPTVSTQIKKLSDTLGVELFEQLGKRIYLTDAGRHLLVTCDRVFDALSDADEIFEALRGLRAGHLALAVSTTANCFAPRVLAAFTRRHPMVKVSLQVHNRAVLIERLARNEDDLYIFANPPSEDVTIQRIAPNPMVAIARADHELTNQMAIPFTRFAQEPFLMREPGSGTRMVVERLFEQHRCTPKAQMELSTNEAVKEAILAGAGVSILSRDAVGLETAQREIAILDVEGFPVLSHWYVVYAGGKQLSVAARAFLDFIHVEAKQSSTDEAGEPSSSETGTPKPRTMQLVHDEVIAAPTGARRGRGANGDRRQAHHRA